MFRGRNVEVETDEKTEIDFLLKFIERSDSFSVKWEGDPTKLLILTIRPFESDQEERFELEARGGPFQMLPKYLEALSRLHMATRFTYNGRFYTTIQRGMVLCDVICELVPIIRKTHLWDHRIEDLLKLWDSMLNP